jgi:hypothetical protein
MYVGNLILNWLVILPVVCGVILLLKIMSFSLNWWSLKEELQWQLPLFFAVRPA